VDLFTRAHNRYNLPVVAVFDFRVAFISHGRRGHGTYHLSPLYRFSGRICPREVRVKQLVDLFAVLFRRSLHEHVIGLGHNCIAAFGRRASGNLLRRKTVH
jgi:hypothetical protein